jgi:hypothetical protein
MNMVFLGSTRLRPFTKSLVGREVYLIWTCGFINAQTSRSKFSFGKFQNGDGHLSVSKNSLCNSSRDSL